MYCSPTPIEPRFVCSAGQGPSHFPQLASYLRIHPNLPFCVAGAAHGQVTFLVSPLGLYKIFVHFKAFVHESVILVLTPPPVMSTLLQY